MEICQEAQKDVQLKFFLKTHWNRFMFNTVWFVTWFCSQIGHPYVSWNIYIHTLWSWRDGQWSATILLLLVGNKIGRLWRLNNVQLVLNGAKEISHTPLNHHHQPAPLTRSRMDSFFHVVYAKLRSYRLNVTAEIKTHQTSSRFSNLGESKN